MAIIKTTFRKLAEIAEKSPGYKVFIQAGRLTYSLSNIRFGRRESGRRDKGTVLADITNDTGKTSEGAFFSDYEVDLLD